MPEIKALNDDQKKHMRLLVAALRSDEFGQVADYLHTKDGYCCLGVACELYRRETGNGVWRSRGFEVYYFDPESKTQGAIPSSFEEAKLLPYHVYDWIGGIGGDIPTTESYASLLNDSGVSFSRIANILEDTYLSEDRKS